MNDKITLPKLASLLAQRTGKNKKTTEEYLRALFGVIADTISQGESVKLKGIGTFKIVLVEERKSVNVSTGEEYIIPSHGKLSFVPSKELAEAVNQPFSMFETVELSDLISEEELDNAEISLSSKEFETGLNTQLKEAEEKEHLNKIASVEVEEKISEQEAPEELSEVSKQSEVQDSLESSETAEYILRDEEKEGVSKDDLQLPIESKKEDEHISLEKDVAEADESEDNEEIPEIRSSKRGSFGYGFLWGVLSSLIIVAIGVGICYYVFNRKLEEAIAVNKEQPRVEMADTIKHVAVTTVSDTMKEDEEVAPTEPSDKDEPVYDTVTTTRYLTTIAKEHYGNYHFWPYIYEENKSKLGHPNKIRPGTQVVVPELSKYGVDATSKSDEAKAKAKGVEIYNRYQ